MKFNLYKNLPSINWRHLRFILWRKFSHIHFRRPNKKSLFRLAFILILVILSQVVILKYFKPGMASAWYNELWLYRKAIVVGNSGSEQTNKVVNVTVNTASLIDSGKLKSNCEDIRFTNSAGTLLDHRTKTGIRFQSADVELASASGTLITNTFTVPEARSNQILIAIVHATRSDQTAIGIDSVTFNGDTMTSAVTLDSQHSNRRLLSAVYYLANPDVGTELNLDVDLTNSAASRAVSTMLFTGVDLDNPILSSASDSGINNTSLPVTGTTSLSNSYIVGGFTREGGDAGAGRPVLDLPARQTYVFVESTGESDLQVAGGFMNAATNGSYTLTARTYKSGGGNTNWNGSWAELNEADCDNASTEFEVLMPTIANGDNTIYMYYGNSSASSIEATLTDSSRAIEYVRTTSVSDDDGGVSSTFSHHLCGSPNVCTATDRVLVVLIHAQTSSEPGIGHIDALSVNYNGDPLTKQAFKDFDDTRYQTTEVWMLKNPDEGNYSVAVQFSVSTNAFAIAAMTFENVEQKFYFHEVDDDGASTVTTQTLNFNTSLDDSVVVGGAMRRNLNDWQVDVDSPGTATYDIDQTDDLNRTVIEASGGYQEAASAGVHSIDFSISGGTSSGAELMTSAGIALQPETDYDDFTPTSGPILGSEESQSPHAIFLKFDEGVDDSCPSGKDACDSGLEENDATHSASLMWRQEDMCVSGKCLFFDGTDDTATVINTGSIDLNDSLADNFTFSTWVRVNSDGEGSVGEIFDKGGTTYLRTTNDGSDGYADLEASLDLGTAGSANDATVTITNGINLNRWHHIAVTYTDDVDDEITIYIDGVNRGASINGSGAPATDTSDLLIGGSSGANFHGFIDEFKIYYTERTAAQIKLETQLESTYEGSSASFGGNQKYLSDGLLAYWNMDDAGSASVTDSSGNNFALTNSSTSVSQSNGKFFNASYFDNSSDLLILTGGMLRPAQTFVFWVYPTNLTDSLIRIDDVPETLIQISSGTISTTSVSNPKIYVNGIESSTLQANIWQHVAVTTDTSINPAGTSFSPDGTGTMFDDVRFYSRQLSLSDLESLYRFGPSPVGYWDLNENTSNTTYDRSGSGSNLTLTSTDTPLPKRKPGKYGGALDFDGSTDYAIDTTPGSGLGITGDLTLSAWVYRESTIDDDTIIDRSGNSTGSADNVNYQFYINDTDNILRLFWESGSEVAETVSSTVAITNSTNTWVHLSVTRDVTNNEVRFYENGVQLGAAVTYTNDPSGGGTSPSVSLGRRAETAFGYFDGAIDDVKVYNYIRNTQQLVQDMNANHPAPGSPVGSSVAHWKFDENALSACSASTGDYPIVSDKGTQYNTNSSPTTTHNIDMPSNINTGDLLLIISSSNDPGTLTGISGWTSLINNDVPNLGAYVAYKKADSTEGASATISTTNSVNMVARIWRITRWHGTTAPEINYTLENDRNTNGINPPSLTPSWGLANTLWIAEGSWLNNPLSTYPTSYDDNQETAITNGTNDIAYAAATREYSATSENPGIFTISSSSQAHLELTIAVRPGYNYICDSSANLNHLTYTNSYGGFTRSGKFGSAYDGADNNRAVRDDDSDFDFSNGSDEFTLSGWIKRSAISNQEYILDKHETNDGYTLYMDSDGDFVFGIGDGAASFPEESIGGSLSRNYDDDIWHHVTAVKKSTEYIKLYVDGREIASDTSLSVTGDMSNSGKLILGDDDETDGTDEFLGDIDDVKIFRSALSENQIKLLYNQSSSAVWGASSTDASGNASFASDRSYCPPGDTTATCAPVGEWKLDENTGTNRADDTSTNARLGTLINVDATDWVQGKLGSGLNLNGTDEYIDIGTGPSTVRTISFWVKPATTTEYFINLTSNTDYISASSGTIGMTGDASETIYVNGVATTTITANIWQHVIVVTSANENASNLDIGRTTDTNYLEGVIDDVKIYDYALSPSQVAWNYSKGEPIVRYKFDECLGNVAYDSGYKADPSSTRHDGTITPSSSGNTTVGTCGSGTSTEMWNDGTNGKMNGSMGFDGTDDYVVTTTDSRLQGNNSFSVTAWVKPNSFGSANAVVALFGSSTDKGYWLNVGSDGSVTLWISTNGSAQSAPPTYAGTISTGQWSHLVGTFDGSAIKIYVNGRLISSGSVSGPVHTVSTSNAFAIGRLGATSADYFNGLIDDVRIYKYALSSQQVLTVMNDGAIRFAPLTGSPQ